MSVREMTREEMDTNRDVHREANQTDILEKKTRQTYEKKTRYERRPDRHERKKTRPDKRANHFRTKTSAQSHHRQAALHLLFSPSQRVSKQLFGSLW
jgi:hypothetical protein